MIFKIIFKIWGLGIGDWGLGPIPNPQSPIPKMKCINLLKIVILVVLEFNILFLIVRIFTIN